MFALFEFAAYAVVVLAGTASLVVCRLWFRQRHLQKIPGPSNPSLFWGHGHHMFNPYAYSFHEGLFRTYGKVARVYGFLGDAQLVVSDPKACNNIIVKDEPIFQKSEGLRCFNKRAFGSLSLASATGAHHRMQRKLLNPAFNVNHMRHMTPIFHKITNQLRENLWSIVSNGPEEVDVADWMGKLALELIAQGSLGYSFGTLEGRDDEFCEVIKGWIVTVSSLAVAHNFLPFVDMFHPKILRFLGRALPLPKLHQFMDMVDTLESKSRSIHETKKRLLELGDDATVKPIGDGKDIISLLMRAGVTETKEDRLSEQELISQMGLFLIAGSDTTSNALSRALHLLALHPDAQDRLRKELKGVHESNEELTHDQLVSLPFLEAVCRETLRLYPPSPGVSRVAQSDVVLPLSAPIQDVDGRKVHEIFVPKDTSVFVQIYNLNRDPSIWGADAAEWKPERWLAPLPQSVSDANIQGVYGNTMTFIGGTRSCIGSKLAQIEIKVVLSQIIPAFRFATTGAEIVWRFGFISTPSVKGSVEEFRPKLPLMVSRV